MDCGGSEEVRSEGGEDGDDGEGEEAVVGGEENHENGVGVAVDLVKQVMIIHNITRTKCTWREERAYSQCIESV